MNLGGFPPIFNFYKHVNCVFAELWKYICMIHSANKYFSSTLCVTDPVLANSLTSRSLGSGWGGGRGMHKIKCHMSVGCDTYLKEGRKLGQGRAGMLFQTGRTQETLRSWHHLEDEQAVLWSEMRAFKVEGTRTTKAPGGNRLVCEEQQRRPMRLAWSEGGVGGEQHGVHPQIHC